MDLSHVGKQCLSSLEVTKHRTKEHVTKSQPNFKTDSAVVSDLEKHQFCAGSAWLSPWIQENVHLQRKRKKKPNFVLRWGWDPSQSQAGRFPQVTQKSRILAETIQPALAEGKAEQRQFRQSQSWIKKSLAHFSKSQILTCIFFSKFNSFPFSTVN